MHVALIHHSSSSLLEILRSSPPLPRITLMPRLPPHAPPPLAARHHPRVIPRLLPRQMQVRSARRRDARPRRPEHGRRRRHRCGAARVGLRLTGRRWDCCREHGAGRRLEWCSGGGGARREGRGAGRSGRGVGVGGRGRRLDREGGVSLHPVITCVLARCRFGELKETTTYMPRSSMSVW
jgi:hypothetical protein